MNVPAAIFFVAAVTSGIHCELAAQQEQWGWVAAFTCYLLVSIAACTACIISRRPERD